MVKNAQRAASRSKPGQKPVEQSDKVSAAVQRTRESTKVISEKSLKKLLSDDAQYAEEIATLTGKLRADIKEAVDKKGLDKDCYAIIKKFRSWTPEKLAFKWPILLLYMELSGLEKQIDSVLQLDLGDQAGAAEQGDDEQEDGDEDGGGKGAKPEFGAKARADRAVKDLAEAAGAAPGPGGR